MPCPICTKEPGSGDDHRWCLVQLFQENVIQSVDDWLKLCNPPKPKTVVKGKITIQVKKEDIE